MGTGNWFCRGKRGHKVIDFTNFMGQNKESEKESSSNVHPPNKNHLYALRSRGE